MFNQNCHHAIGVFDSGLGGLTVVKELMRQLPSEDIVYYGDTARVPYGMKSKESIVRFSKENTRALLKHKVKMVVVACNSSSSYALTTLKRNFSLPIVGVIHAGAKKAVQMTRNRRIGVMATSATINSQEYQKTIHWYDASVKVFNQACPLLVPLVEEGWLEKEVTLKIVAEYLSSLKKAKIDTLILGCTHYPLLKEIIKKVMGKGVVLIDSAQEIALEVKQILAETQIMNTLKRKPKYQFLVTDRAQAFERVAKNFLGYPIKMKVESNHV